MAEKDRLRWNKRFHAERDGWAEHAPFLDEIGHFLPQKGKAIDVGGGPGRNAFWMAKRGLDVTLADISSVALQMAKERAEKSNLAISCLEVDLDEEEFPKGPWHVILCNHYLPTPLIAQFSNALEKNGILVVCHPTEMNLERHKRPSKRFLIAEGALRAKLSGFELLYYEEGWFSDIHEVRLIAKKTEQVKCDGE